MKPVRITYYVHGTTTDNEKGLSSGWHDCSLSDLGRKQSVQLKGMIKKKPDVVFCSDLKRAVESARLTYGKSVPIIQDTRLREINYGDLTQADSGKVDSLILKHIEKQFPNGESYMDVEKRVRSFLDELLKKYSGKHVDIVAHRAPQLALDVILRGRSWEQAVREDWRLRKDWKAGWEYILGESVNS
jgi:alpha-ribazole phosphatase/probable phosphoglycerate mutase